MKRTLLLSTLLVFTFFGLAQDTGGEMMEDMTGGMMTGGEMTGGMSGGMTGGAMMTDDAEFDSLDFGFSMSGGDMSMMDTSSMTIAEVVAANPDFGILAQLLGAAGLTETLNGEGPFTVFAPNDDAFLPFTNNEIVSLLGDTDALTNILTYHVVSGELTSTDLDRDDLCYHLTRRRPLHQRRRGDERHDRRHDDGRRYEHDRWYDRR